MIHIFKVNEDGDFLHEKVRFSVQAISDDLQESYLVKGWCLSREEMLQNLIDNNGGDNGGGNDDDGGNKKNNNNTDALSTQTIASGEGTQQTTGTTPTFAEILADKKKELSEDEYKKYLRTEIEHLGDKAGTNSKAETLEKKLLGLLDKAASEGGENGSD